MRFKSLVEACAFLALAIPVLAVAQDEEDDYPVSDIIHSDLPLYADAGDARLWPQHFSEGEGESWSFGCTSRVAFGDWELKGHWPEEMNIGGWYRFSNYGVFHCYANFWQADERAELEQGEFSRGFFIELGEANIGGAKRELWAIQKGMLPGSDYLLLARMPGGEGAIKSFDLLQRKCPKANVRNAGNIDIAYTRYCAINSRQELVSLAKRMARLKPIGTMALVPEEEGSDQATDPSASSPKD